MVAGVGLGRAGDLLVVFPFFPHLFFFHFPLVFTRVDYQFR